MLLDSLRFCGVVVKQLRFTWIVFQQECFCEEEEKEEKVLEGCLMREWKGREIDMERESE